MSDRHQGVCTYCDEYAATCHIGQYRMCPRCWARIADLSRQLRDRPVRRAGLLTAPVPHTTRFEVRR